MKKYLRNNLLIFVVKSSRDVVFSLSVVATVIVVVTTACFSVVAAITYNY